MATEAAALTASLCRKASVPITLTCRYPLEVQKEGGTVAHADHIPYPVSAMPLNDAELGAFGRALANHTGLTLFNVDLVRHIITGEWYVVDINYFPGVDKLDGFEERLLDWLLVLKAKATTAERGGGSGARSETTVQPSIDIDQTAMAELTARLSALPSRTSIIEQAKALGLRDEELYRFRCDVRPRRPRQRQVLPSPQGSMRARHRHCAGSTLQRS